MGCTLKGTHAQESTNLLSHVEMATEQEVLCRAIDEELAAFLRCIDNYETASREVSRACKPASALCCDAGSAPTESASPWGSLGA